MNSGITWLLLVATGFIGRWGECEAVDFDHLAIRVDRGGEELFDQGTETRLKV